MPQQQANLNSASVAAICEQVRSRLFFVIPGALSVCLHRPTWPPFRGRRTLDASLRPGGGVLGGGGTHYRAVYGPM